MKPSVSTMLLTICLGGFLTLAAPLPAQEAEESMPDSLATTLVSPKILESRIAEVEATTGMEEKAKEAGIVIAFQQRDMHIDTSEPLRISIEDSRLGNS